VSDELTFEGRTVLVTGSGRNIGKALILEFAAHGANVIVNVRTNREQGEQVAAEARRLGVEAEVVLGAPSDKDTIESLKSTAERSFGGVDIYVSNAATRLHKTFDETTDDDWHFFLNQQLTASWYLAKAFAPRMREKGWGRIIHMNGADAWSGGATRLPHSTAKGGLRTLTKSLAEALGPHGITVNDVSPGFTSTVRDPNTHPEAFEEGAGIVEALLRQMAIGRQPTPEEVAWACLFLASERSAAITGSVIHVDGGSGRHG
jgi:3-oxoacyl-[acyl-carrier protein] reductase